MSRLRLPALLLALVLAGCDSQIHMAATPATTPITADVGVPATINPTTQTVTIYNTSQLPDAVRNASDLKVAIAGQKLQVSRTGAFYTFTIPPTVHPQQDKNGNMTVVFIGDDAASQIVTLRTGSPVNFADPAIVTAPASGTVTRGEDVTLTANTDADPAKYQFLWSASQTPQGPWQSIAGEGKTVKWTPAASGSYYIKLDTIDRQNSRPYSTVTPTALVYVNDASGVITTDPVSGSVTRGNQLTLKFNKPASITGSNLSYAWSYSASPQGPWQQISGDSDTVSWLPATTGQFYVKVDVTNKDTGKVNTFYSSQPAAYVSEGASIVTASQSSVQRGDKVTLTANVSNPSNAPLSWYYSTTGPQGPWTAITSGNGSTVDFIATLAGSYYFQVNVPQPNNAFVSLATTSPVLNATESTPIITSDPVNAIASPGDSVSLVLNARGLPESTYQYIFSYAQSPTGPWTTLPLSNVDDLYKKTRNWKTSTATPPGAYYIKVDAAQRSGTASYTFISSTPVVTIQSQSR